MISEKFGLGWVGRSFLVMLLLGAIPAQALDLSDLQVIYHEDFEGETAFPTVPEVNVLSFGDNVTAGRDGDSNPIIPPLVSGGAALASLHSEVPLALQQMLVPATYIGDILAARATFDSSTLRALPEDQIGNVHIAVVYGVIDVVASLHVNTYSSGPDVGTLVVRYQEGQFPGSATGVPIYRLDDTIMVNDNADLWDGSIDNALCVDENLLSIRCGISNSPVWTGAADNGTGSDCSPGRAGGIRNVSRQRRLDGDARRRLGAPTLGADYMRFS